MTSKPKPPTWNEIEADQRAEMAARALGFELDLKTLPERRKDEILHSRMTDKARAEKRAVGVRDVEWSDIFSNLNRAHSAVCRMSEAGRLVQVSKGLYLPIVEQAAG